MAFWIFQGNPKVFDVDTYLQNNEIVTWDVRQKQYVHEIHPGDSVSVDIKTSIRS